MEESEETEETEGEEMEETEELVVYGTAWCPAVAHVRALLDAHGAPYRYHDIDADKKAAKAVYRLQGGTRRVPTLTLPDGTTLVEPSADRLTTLLDSLDSGRRSTS